MGPASRTRDVIEDRVDGPETVFNLPLRFPVQVTGMFCGICGKKNPDDAVRCEACGNIIAQDEE